MKIVEFLHDKSLKAYFNDSIAFNVRLTLFSTVSFSQFTEILISF